MSEKQRFDNRSEATTGCFLRLTSSLSVDIFFVFSWHVIFFFCFQSILFYTVPSKDMLILYIFLDLVKVVSVQKRHT